MCGEAGPWALAEGGGQLCRARLLGVVSSAVCGLQGAAQGALDEAPWP